MLTRIVVSLVIFASVFYLVKLFYPFLQVNLAAWQKRRLEAITPKVDSIFLDIPLKKLMLLDVFSPLCSGLAGFLFFRNLWVALGAAAAGLAVPALVIKQLESMRRKKFVSQLVDGLLVLSSALKAGLSLVQAFFELTAEMPAPINQEFSLVVRQMQMGVSLEEALTNLKKRIRSDEVDLVVTAMLVARESGGDLTVTFSRLVNTIQERNKLVGRVRALCAQGQLQGVIMSALPVLFGIFVYKVNPNFFDAFLKDDFGRLLLIYAFFSELIGVFLIWKLSRVEV